MNDDLWRNTCKGACYFCSLLFVCFAIVEVGIGFDSPPPPHPESGLSPHAWLAFIKAVAAAAGALLLAKGGGYITVANTERPKHDGSELVLKVPNNAERIAYHAIIARKEDGSLANYYILAHVREGTKGYMRQPEMGQFFDYREAQDRAEALNAELGLRKMKAQGLISRWRG